MSLLPTAHAAQSFGACRIDFFAVPGRVVGDRAKPAAGERRIQDFDGMPHDVRLMDKGAPCSVGDDATILRVQAGPNRRSRAVAVVNHTENAWTRCSPDANALLARAGVTRAFNWWLSMIAFIAVAALAIWPELHIFLSELSAGLMANVPSFNIYADIAERAPGVAAWRLETALPAALRDAIASSGLVPMSQLTAIGAGIGGALLALIAFWARSWRLIYIPAFAAFAVLAGAATGGPNVTLALIGMISVLFLAGGFINRLRDGGRFNARVERLADYVLRNPPQEGVVTTASAAAVGAVAGEAIAQPPVQAEPQAEAAPYTGQDEPATLEGEAAAPGSDDAINGEAEATPAPEAEAETLETPPAETALEASAEALEAEIADTAQAEAEQVEAAAGEKAEEATTPAPAEEATLSEAEEAADAPEAPDAPEMAAEDAPELADAPDMTEAESEPEPEAEPVAEGAESDILDDLPDDEALAAAAALHTAETAGEPAGEVEEAATLEDERTMPLAPPPPMPEPSGEGEAAQPAETSLEDEVMDEIDPVVDADHDPMLDSETADPFAPGAPELEMTEEDEERR